MADKPNTGEDPKPGAPSGIPPTKPAFKQVVPPHIPVNYDITGGLPKLSPEDQEKKRDLEEAAKIQDLKNKERQQLIDEGNSVETEDYPQNIHVKAFNLLFGGWAPDGSSSCFLPVPANTSLAWMPAPSNTSSQAMPLTQTLSGAGPAPAQKRAKVGPPRIALAGHNLPRQAQSTPSVPAAAGPLQVSPAAAGPPQASPAAAGPLQVSPAAAGPLQVSPAAAGPPQASPAAAGPLQVSPAAAGPPQASTAVPFPTHVGPAKFQPKLPRKWAEQQIYAGGGGAGPGYAPGAVPQQGKNGGGGAGAIFAPGAVLYPSKKDYEGAGPGYAPGAVPQQAKKDGGAGDGGSGSSTISPTTRYQWSDVELEPRNSTEFKNALARLKLSMDQEKYDRQELYEKRQKKATKYCEDLRSRIEKASSDSRREKSLLRKLEEIFYRGLCVLMDIFDSEKNIDSIEKSIQLWYDKMDDPHFHNNYVDRSAEVAYNIFNERFAKQYQK